MKPASFIRTILGAAALLLWMSCTDKMKITVSAGDHDRSDCVVRVALKSGMENPLLQETADGETRPVPAQVVKDATGTWLYFILDGSTPAGSSRTFRLSKGSKSHALGMTVRDSGDEVVLGSGGRDILTYRHGISEAPEGVRPIFRRSGYLHPVRTPSGYVVTNIRPDDHFHHFGIWNPWTRVIYSGKMYDLWNIGDSLGTVRSKSVDALYAGSVLAGMDAGLEHVIYAPEGEMKIMDEALRIRAFDAGKGYLWDFESQLDVCAPQDVTFQAYRYQGFCLRATAAWMKGTCTIRSSEGLDRNQIDGTRARWIYINGNDNGTRAGILFMSCPDNHNFPEHIRVWDETQNGGRGDIMLNICPAKFEDWTLPSGSTSTLRYRAYAFDGEMTPEEAERLWTDFAFPPAVAISR